MVRLFGSEALGFQKQSDAFLLVGLVVFLLGVLPARHARRDAREKTAS